MIKRLEVYWPMIAYLSHIKRKLANMGLICFHVQFMIYTSGDWYQMACDQKISRTHLFVWCCCMVIKLIPEILLTVQFRQTIQNRVTSFQFGNSKTHLKNKCRIGLRWCVQYDKFQFNLDISVSTSSVMHICNSVTLIIMCDTEQLIVRSVNHLHAPSTTTPS